MDNIDDDWENFLQGDRYIRQYNSGWTKTINSNNSNNLQRTNVN